MRLSIKFEAREGNDTRPGESRAKETLTKFSIDKRMWPKDEEEQNQRGGGNGKEKRSEIVVGNAHDTWQNCETYVYRYTRRKISRWVECVVIRDTKWKLQPMYKEKTKISPMPRSGCHERIIHASKSSVARGPPRFSHESFELSRVCRKTRSSLAAQHRFEGDDIVYTLVNKWVRDEEKPMDVGAYRTTWPTRCVSWQRNEKGTFIGKREKERAKKLRSIAIYNEIESRQFETRQNSIENITSATAIRQEILIRDFDSRMTISYPVLIEEARAMLLQWKYLYARRCTRSA